MARSVNSIGAKADANTDEALPRNASQTISECASFREIDLAAVLTDGVEDWRGREDIQERNYDLLKNFGRLDRDLAKGPVGGIGEGDPYLAESLKLCVEFGCQSTSAMAAYEAGKVLGSTIAGARLAGGELSQPFIDGQRKLLASSILNGSHFLATIDQDEPSDGYDEALRGFDDGMELPRTDLKGILEEHRQVRATAQRRSGTHSHAAVRSRCPRRKRANRQRRRRGSVCAAASSQSSSA